MSRTSVQIGLLYIVVPCIATTTSSTTSAHAAITLGMSRTMPHSTAATSGMSTFITQTVTETTQPATPQIHVVTSTLSANTVDIRGEWTPWSSCSKSCDVGMQSRSKSVGGEIRREEQYCNLEYCPDNFCTKNTDCRGLTGWVSCINNACFCESKRYFDPSYTRYYNKHNCYPEVENCVIQENPPYSLGQPKSLQFGLKPQGCVANDNPENEVHVIGIYGEEFDNTYTVVIRPRGKSNKPIILVLSSYYVTNWRIDTTVHLDSIIYGSALEDTLNMHHTVEIINDSKCGSSNIVRWDRLGAAVGYSTTEGNTVKVLLQVGRIYGSVTSFTSATVLFYPRTFTLEVGGNPLQKRPFIGFQYTPAQCTKVTPMYIGNFTEKTDTESATSGTSNMIPAVIVSLTVGVIVVVICVFCNRRKAMRANRASTCNTGTSDLTPMEYQTRVVTTGGLGGRNRNPLFNDQQRISSPDILADISTAQIHAPYHSVTPMSLPVTAAAGCDTSHSWEDLPPPYSPRVQEYPQSRTEPPFTITYISWGSGNYVHTESGTSSAPVVAATAGPMLTCIQSPPDYFSSVHGLSQTCTDLPPSYESLLEMENRQNNV